MASICLFSKAVSLILLWVRQARLTLYFLSTAEDSGLFSVSAESADPWKKKKGGGWGEKLPCRKDMEQNKT